MSCDFMELADLSDIVNNIWADNTIQENIEIDENIVDNGYGSENDFFTNWNWDDVNDLLKNEGVSINDLNLSPESLC